jgi:hypothetical protein
MNIQQGILNFEIHHSLPAPFNLLFFLLNRGLILDIQRQSKADYCVFDILSARIPWTKLCPFFAVPKAFGTEDGEPRRPFHFSRRGERIYPD